MVSGDPPASGVKVTSNVDICEAKSQSKSNRTPSSIVMPLAALVASCGGGGSSTSQSDASGPTTMAGSTTPIEPSSDARAARFLLHASFSASPTEISALRSLGYEDWLNDQMASPIETTASQFYSQRGFDQINADNHFDRSTTADNMIWNQLWSGENPVRKRIALALSEFFVVSLKELDIQWPAIAIGAYWDVLIKHSFGNFRDLLEAITLNPAMAAYLDTLGNRRADPVTGRQPDENFAREVMQLFTIGLDHLNQDGSPKFSDAQNSPTFDNVDVMGLAKCFTGFNFDYTSTTIASYPNRPDWPLATPEFVTEPITPDTKRWAIPETTSYHSTEEKSFLGVTIPANTAPLDSLGIALDTLFEHPNVAPFFSKQMIQRLVTSNPSPSYVERVSSVFNDNGQGERGDLRTVFKAILLDEEAVSDTNLSSASFGKLREPILRLAQWGRTFGVRSASGDWAIDPFTREYDQLGQAPLRSPSVFNFFRPTFVGGSSDAERNGLTAPEFQLVNETSVAGYVNFLQLMIEGRSFSNRDLRISYSEELEIAHDSDALLNRLDLLLTAGQLSEASKQSIREALESVEVSQATNEATKLRRVQIGVFLVMVSADYLVQK